MKSSKQCPKCDSLRIGCLAAQPDVNLAGGRKRFLGNRVTTFRNQEQVSPVGALETYFCTDCGFHETYVSAPASIGFEELEGFRWVNPLPRREGPFR